MSLLMWFIALLGSSYAIGHAYFLIKDKNKIGAIGIGLVGIFILFFAFIIRLK